MQFATKLFILLIPVIVYLFYLPKIKKPLSTLFMHIYLILLIGASLLGIGKYVYENSHQPPKWDFLVFWLNGKAGVSGENFYDKESYQKITLPYEPGSEFREEIIDAGFWYPPFTMFLFLPLGIFDISKAYLLWQILNMLLCVACIYGLWRLFLKNHGILSFLLIAALLLMLSPARSTFSVSQTNFLTLLLFLMFWQNRSKMSGGIWLALCVVVKPYMALLYMYPLLTRKWKTLVTAVLSLLTITLLSIIAFGSDVFLSFLHNPTPNTPNYVYTEMINQSLLATILRLTQHQITSESPLSNPIFLSVSLLLILITVWVMVKKNNNQDWVILSVLFLALMIYPASLAHYGVFLIVPVVLLLGQPDQSAKERMIKFFIISIAYLISGYHSGDYMFFANLFMWLVCIIYGARPVLEEALVLESTKPPVMIADSVSVG